GGFAAAMLGALWGYDGWNNLTLVAGEIKNPQRNIPRALIGGMLVVAALYIIANVAYFYVLSPTQVANIPAQDSVATVVVGKFLGAGAVTIMAAALLCSTFGSLHTSILTGARVPYAMSRDGLLNKWVGRVSRRTRVPVTALILQGMWAGLLTLSGTYDSLTDYVIFASWIFYGLATASVFIFRRRMPDAVRPYRTWGYPVVPAIFLVVTTWLLISTIITAPVKTLIGIGFIILGLPVYQILSRTRTITKSA
ncbi:MAG: APC family permease, partial [Pyrinomonadaceae bacterium]